METQGYFVFFLLYSLHKITDSTLKIVLWPDAMRLNSYCYQSENVRKSGLDFKDRNFNK